VDNRLERKLAAARIWWPASGDETRRNCPRTTQILSAPRKPRCVNALRELRQAREQFYQSIDARRQRPSAESGSSRSRLTTPAWPRIPPAEQHKEIQSLSVQPGAISLWSKCGDACSAGAEFTPSPKPLNHSPPAADSRDTLVRVEVHRNSPCPESPSKV